MWHHHLHAQMRSISGKTDAESVFKLLSWMPSCEAAIVYSQYYRDQSNISTRSLNESWCMMLNINIKWETWEACYVPLREIKKGPFNLRLQSSVDHNNRTVILLTSSGWFALSTFSLCSAKFIIRSINFRATPINLSNSNSKCKSRKMLTCTACEKEDWSK